MDATLATKADELAKELATKATTVEELNDVMRSLMKTALERMLNTELEVHLADSASDVTTVAPEEARLPFDDASAGASLTLCPSHPTPLTTHHSPLTH